MTSTTLFAPSIFAIEPDVLSDYRQLPIVNQTAYSQTGYNPGHSLYGYTSISQIYENIANALLKYPELYGLKLKDTTELEIRSKIEKLKILENEILQSIKNQPQYSTYGTPFTSQYSPEILAQHTNLLNLLTDYNAKVANLSNILQTIINVLTEKSKNPSYHLSMKMTYPAPQIAPVYSGIMY